LNIDALSASSRLGSHGQILEQQGVLSATPVHAVWNASRSVGSEPQWSAATGSAINAMEFILIQNEDVHAINLRERRLGSRPVKEGHAYQSFPGLDPMPPAPTNDLFAPLCL
jgi:hypothetical protein